MCLTWTGILSKSSTKASEEPHIGKMVTPRLGNKISFVQLINLVGIIACKSSSHTSNSCCPWEWTAGESDGTRTRGLLRDRHLRR